MATKAHSTSAFMTKLLAPLPEGEEPVASKGFVRAIRHDIWVAWRRGQMAMHEARDAHKASAIADRHGLRSDGIMTVDDAWDKYVGLQASQCLIPAPTMVELKWKKRRSPWILERPGVAEVIARDEKRLAA